MLDKLDTLIAFATVMLGVSLIITIVNQMIASLLGHRATYLKDGIKDLLATLDPNLGPNLEKIANDVLTHKLASDSVFAHQGWAPTRWKMASTIRPQELTRLLDLVSSGQPYAANIQAILTQINPTVEREAQLLANTVNLVAPGGPATADQLIKQLSDKASKAIGRLESAFNSTMDRVSQRFTLQMRIWTIVFSLAFALIYHLDAVKIYSQLATDPQLRATLSDASQTLMKQYETVGGCQAGSADQAKTCDAKVLADNYTKIRDQLSSPQLAMFQASHNWSDPDAKTWGGILRVLATAAFLSLGAPFWYNALKGLVNLRSQVAERQQPGKKT